MAVVEPNRNAVSLVQSLWEYFDGALECQFPQIDPTLPSSCRVEIDAFLETKKLRALAPKIVVRNTDRKEEALVHELLHLNLIRLGFPRFRIFHDDEESEKRNLADGIINLADHFVMGPTFGSLGYREDRFMGRTHNLTEREERTLEAVTKVGNRLAAPGRYTIEISQLLRLGKIAFEAVAIDELAKDAAKK